MTVEGKPEKSINWLNTWKEMEKLYKAHPEKLRAIGTYRTFFLASNPVKYLLNRCLERLRRVPGCAS